ncbi:zinc-binding dehydrogenase [Seiridium cupressi]
MSKYENKAAYLEGAKVRPLAVRDAPYTAPGPGQITIKNEAIALNPLESIKQTIGNFLYEWVKYPFIMGADVSGTVVEVGSNVTRFKVGDRVVAFATGISIQCEKAVVMPLGLTTAACGLFQKDQLGLHHPTPGTKHQTEKEVVIVWGGSTSVGCNAIQLATAAGYEVITTCSERNFDMVKSLGATAAYDYRSPTVTEDIKRACQGKKIAGAMTIGAGGAEKCTEVLGSCKGNRFISMISFPTPSDPNAGALQRIGTFLLFSVKIGFKKTTLGVRSKFVWSSTIEDNELARRSLRTFSPMPWKMASTSAHRILRSLDTTWEPFSLALIG